MTLVTDVPTPSITASVIDPLTDDMLGSTYPLTEDPIGLPALPPPPPQAASAIARTAPHTI